MGPNDSNDDQQRSHDESQQHGADPADRSSGEGAGSAIEAMLRKRLMRVNPEPDPAAAPTSRNQDDKTPGE